MSIHMIWLQDVDDMRSSIKLLDANVVYICVVEAKVRLQISPPRQTGKHPRRTALSISCFPGSKCRRNKARQFACTGLKENVQLNSIYCTMVAFHMRSGY